MKDQFQVWQYSFSERGEHPCVIISHPDAATRSKWINVLNCTCQRQSRPPKPFEVLVNGRTGWTGKRLWIVRPCGWLARENSLTSADRSLWNGATPSRIKSRIYSASPPGIETILLP